MLYDVKGADNDDDDNDDKYDEDHDGDDDGDDGGDNDEAWSQWRSDASPRGSGQDLAVICHDYFFKSTSRANMRLDYSQVLSLI